MTTPVKTAGPSLLEQMASKSTLYRNKTAFRVIFTLSLCLLPLTLILAFSYVTGDWTRSLTALPFLLTGLLTWGTMRSGQFDRGFKISIYGAWIGLAIVLLSYNGIRASSISGFCLILIIAAWFAGQRAALILTAATLVLYAFLAVADIQGWSYPVQLRNPTWYVLLVNGFMAICAGALGYLAAKSFNGHLVEERDARAALAASLVALQERERELDQAQGRLREMNQDLEYRVAERTARLQSLTRELSDFSYTISHDLRTPLRSINGHSSVLLEEESATLSESALRRLQAIARSSDQLGRMVDTLLMVIRLAQTRIRREPIHMRNLVLNLAPQWQEKYPAARLSVGELEPANADADLVRQLFEILLDNAFKFSASRESPIIEVGWDPQQDAWFVRDNGIGFDMRYVERVWGLFERLNGTEQPAGLGVGLAVADRIVQCHGGDIWAVSAPDEGACFYFTLRPAEDSARAVQELRMEAERRGQLSGRRVEDFRK